MSIGITGNAIEAAIYSRIGLKVNRVAAVNKLKNET